MDVRLYMTAKLWESVIITVAAHLLACANGSSSNCSFWDSAVVMCKHRNLTTLPNWIPSNVAWINLSDNPFIKLQEDSFARFTSLRTLLLSHCNLNLPLQLPKDLEIIDLEGNSFSIENVAKMFKRMQKSRIRYLHMGANNLTLDKNHSITLSCLITL